MRAKEAFQPSAWAACAMLEQKNISAYADEHGQKIGISVPAIGNSSIKTCSLLCADSSHLVYGYR